MDQRWTNHPRISTGVASRSVHRKACVSFRKHADSVTRARLRFCGMVGARDYLAFAAQWLAYALTYRRFAVILADANARLGADAVCYSFIVVTLDHLLFAGVYRRTKNQDI